MGIGSDEVRQVVLSQLIGELFYVFAETPGNARCGHLRKCALFDQLVQSVRRFDQFLWSAWPAQEDPVLEDYLNEDGSAPSAMGHEVWGNFLVDYFISD